MSASDSHSPQPNEQAHPPFTYSAAVDLAVPSAANLGRELSDYQPFEWPPSVPQSFLPADLYFNEAIATYHSSPSPQRSFLDNILNPASHHAQPNHLPFDYPPRASPPYRRPRSPVLPHIDSTDMSPSRHRPSRLPNGYVDLTISDPAPTPTPEVRRKRHSVTSGPSTKRLKVNDGSSASAQQDPASSGIEEIDLSDEKRPVVEVLQKQRADAVKAQTKPDEKPTTFNSFTCVICMDTPTDITATSCGHLFCHTCLMEALIAGENRSGPNEPKRSQCPVCRKFINRTKATDIIPLLMKKGLATQPRKSSVNTSKVTS